jgi:molybdopterin molybdotransferase
MKPGKPLVLARIRDRLYFGLPGNPVSSMVSFLLFVAPALRRAMGQRNDLFSPMVLARLAAPLRSKGDRRVYNRVRVVSRDGELVAHPMRAQGSGVSTSMLAANGLAILDVGVESASEGELIPTLLYGPIISSPESPNPNS